MKTQFKREFLQNIYLIFLSHALDINNSVFILFNKFRLLINLHKALKVEFQKEKCHQQSIIKIYFAFEKH